MTIWTHQGPGLYTATNMHVERKFGGWGMTYNPRAKRIWAAFVNGRALTNKVGDVRTFESSDAAKKAAEQGD